MSIKVLALTLLITKAKTYRVFGRSGSLEVRGAVE